MKMISIAPADRVASLVRDFTIVETDDEATRVLMPDTGVIVGIRFGGSATQLDGPAPVRMPDNAITGLRTTARTMRTSAGGGMIFANLREGAGQQVLGVPLHELFGQSVALDDLLPHALIDEAQSRIAEARDHAERVALFENLLLARRRREAVDALVATAIAVIRRQRGSLRIAALARYLDVAQDTLEKRFRRAVGASPKQFASILRLRHAVQSYRSGASLTRASIDAGYFDQPHFNREFRRITGESPQRFLNGVEYC